MPEAVRNLLDYSLLKTAAETIGVETVDRRHNIVNLKFHEQSRVEPARLLDLVRQTTGAQFTPAGVLRLPIPGLPTASGVLAFLWERLRTLSP
ncbi:MAG: TRCF domain-containing protein, partial [Bryobacteraceae bacterium]